IAKQVFAGRVPPARVGKRRARPGGAFQMMIEKRHPARRSFEKAEFQAGELFRNLAGDEIAKADDRRQVRRGEGAVQFEIEEVEQAAAALAGVDADRQADLFRFGVDRKEVRIVEGQRADNAAEEKSGGAVLLG